MSLLVEFVIPNWKSVPVTVIERLFAAAPEVSTTLNLPLGEEVPIPTFPELVTTKSEEVAEVAEVEEIENATCVFEVEARCKERFANGEVVPMPTLPALVITKLVLVEEPTTNCGALPNAEVGLTERRPQGVVELTPTKPVVEANVITFIFASASFNIFRFPVLLFTKPQVPVTFPALVPVFLKKIPPYPAEEGSITTPSPQLFVVATMWRPV